MFDTLKRVFVRRRDIDRNLAGFEQRNIDTGIHIRSMQETAGRIEAAMTSHTMTAMFAKMERIENGCIDPS